MHITIEELSKEYARLEKAYSNSGSTGMTTAEFSASLGLGMAAARARLHVLRGAGKLSVGVGKRVNIIGKVVSVPVYSIVKSNTKRK